MDENIEKSFSNFLETLASDKIFDNFQCALKKAFTEGYNAGKKIDVKIIYIKIKK